MRLIIIAAIVAALSISAFAQDKAQPKAADKPVAADTKKEAPETATIPAETVKSLQDKAKDAETAGLRAENLKLKIDAAGLRAENLKLNIDAAQAELKKLTEDAEAAKSESNAAFQRAAIKAGIPGDRITEYGGEVQKDGSLRLTRRPATAPTPAPQPAKP